MRYLVALAVISCAPPAPAPHCVTRCGIEYQGEYPGREQVFACDALQVAEDRFVAAAHLATDKRFSPPDAVCRKLRGRRLWTKASGCWDDQYGRHVCGITECWSNQVQVAADVPPASSALAHELAHVVQSCSPYGPAGDGEDEHHAGWRRDSINDVIEAAQIRAP